MRMRVFTKINGEPINDLVARVEFDCTALGYVGRVIRRDGKDRGTHCPWSLRDAESLVSTGHWEEAGARDLPLTGQEDAW